MDTSHTLEASPAERRRRRVREAILSAAERVFAVEGEAGLSIRRLADEIDYSPAAIYKYFGSKNELVDELKEAFFERILGKIDDQRSSTEAYPARARSCLATYVRTALEKPHHYAAAFSSIEADTEEHNETEPADHHASNKGRAFQYLSELVKEGIYAGHFRAELKPDEAAKALWASCHGLAMMMSHISDFPAMPHEPPQDRDAFIDYHSDLLIRGLEA
ncbi:MAG: TetR/AcrR family transcriptional regulator [Pseudomonadota bacterium]